jgi:Flp pilus assembly protein CpaB
VLAVALAAAAALAVGSLSNRARHTLDAYGRLRSVAVASRDLEPGRRLTGADIARRDFPVAAIPRDALDASPVGRTLVDDLGPGEVITTRDVAPAGLHGLAALVGPGQRAVSIPVPAHGLDLEVGDRVDVIATDASGASDDEDNPSLGPIVARHARVLEAGDQAVVVEVTADETISVAAALAQGTPVLALVGAP